MQNEGKDAGLGKTYPHAGVRGLKNGMSVELAGGSIFTDIERVAPRDTRFTGILVKAKGGDSRPLGQRHNFSKTNVMRAWKRGPTPPKGVASASTGRQAMKRNFPPPQGSAEREGWDACLDTPPRTRKQEMRKVVRQMDDPGNRAWSSGWMDCWETNGDSPWGAERVKAASPQRVAFRHLRREAARSVETDFEVDTSGIKPTRMDPRKLTVSWRNVPGKVFTWSNLQTDNPSEPTRGTLTLTVDRQDRKYVQELFDSLGADELRAYPARSTMNLYGAPDARKIDVGMEEVEIEFYLGGKRVDDPGTMGSHAVLVEGEYETGL